jgi:hypothetical protein
MTLNPAAFVPPVVSTVAAQQGEQWTLGAYLPLKDAAFVRVMNPVRSDVGAPASWASIAGEGFVVDATTEWYDMADDRPDDRPDDRSDDRPDEGSLDPETARSLARILRSHTTTPAECSFLVWEGYAGFRDDLLPAVTIELTSGRPMLVLSGDLDDGAESVEETPWCRTPQWWIPADGAWLVGNDIYGMSVYVAGTADAIAEILADETIEAYRATPSTRIIAEEFAPNT